MDDTGIEPVTVTMSMWYSTAEIIIQNHLGVTTEDRTRISGITTHDFTIKLWPHLSSFMLAEASGIEPNLTRSKLVVLIPEYTTPQQFGPCGVCRSTHSQLLARVYTAPLNTWIIWQAHLESNQERRNQNPLLYHLTMSQQMKNHSTDCGDFQGTL